MKVILNKDLATLGEEGDVKEVAKGYARNYLFPRGIAVPYTPGTVKLFEARKDEIEAKKVQKRSDALGLKEQLENLELNITMPAGANGRLYGAVTSHTVADELLKKGFQIERKRIDLAGTGIKNVGKYKATIKLYENSYAEIQISIIGQEIKTETAHAPVRPSHRHKDGARSGAAAEVTPSETPPAFAAESAEASAAESAAETAVPSDTAAAESAAAPAAVSAAAEAVEAAVAEVPVSEPPQQEPAAAE